MRFKAWKYSLLVLTLLTACGSGGTYQSLPGELANTRFEDNSHGAPVGWHLDQKVVGKGSVEVLAGHPESSGHVVKISPNAANHGADLLGVGQMLNAEIYRGKTVKASVRAGAEGDSVAIIGVHLLGSDGDLGYLQFRQPDSSGELKLHSDQLEVSQDAEAVVVYLIVDGQSGHAYIDDVELEIVEPAALQASFETDSPATITADLSQSLRVVPATLFGTNIEWIHDGQGLWSAQSNEINTQGIELSRDLGVSLIRFPGGVFSDYYHWQDALGKHASRKTSLHFPGGPKSKHNFGIIEADQFAKATSSQLLLTVNAGTGTAREAADWVSFMNGDAAHQSVKYWEVGNELYMKGDLSGAEMSAKEYASTFLQFASDMRKADPDIKVGAIGGVNRGRYSFINDRRWSETLLKKAAGEIDFLAVHNAYAPALMGVPDSIDGNAVYRALLAAPENVRKNLEDLDVLLKRYEKPGKPISIAVTEWGPFFHVSPESPWVDHIKTLGSALFVGGTLNNFIRDPRVEIATFFKLTDTGFMGWVGNKGSAFSATAPYYAFQLYTEAIGTTLVESTVSSAGFSSPSLGVVDRVEDVPYLDAIVLKGQEEVLVYVVNRNIDRAVSSQLMINGLAGFDSLQRTVLSGTAIDAHTGTQLPNIPGLKWAEQVNVARFSKGGESEITLETTALSNRDSIMALDFAPRSITRLRFSGVSFEAN